MLKIWPKLWRQNRVWISRDQHWCFRNVDSSCSDAVMIDIDTPNERYEPEDNFRIKVCLNRTSIAYDIITNVETNNQNKILGDRHQCFRNVYSLCSDAPMTHMNTPIESWNPEDNVRINICLDWISRAWDIIKSMKTKSKDGTSLVFIRLPIQK